MGSLLASPNTHVKEGSRSSASRSVAVLHLRMPLARRIISGVLAVYPFTAWIQNVDGLVGRMQVPLTVLAAGADTYNNCCMIDKAREIEKAAKTKGAAFEMTVYDNAEHGFDLTGRNYRHDYIADTWKRTEAWLARAQSRIPANRA